MSESARFAPLRNAERAEELLPAQNLADRAAGSAAAAACLRGSRDAALGWLDQDPSLALEGHGEGLAPATADQVLHADAGLHPSLEPVRPGDRGLRIGIG